MKQDLPCQGCGTPTRTDPDLPLTCYVVPGWRVTTTTAICDDCLGRLIALLQGFSSPMASV